MRKSLLISALMHIFVIALMLADISIFAPKQVKNSPAVLMVDLTKVQLASKTNLPPKAEQKKVQKPIEKPKPKREESKPQKTQPKSMPEKKQPVVQPKEKPKPKDAVAVKSPQKKKEAEKTKETPQKNTAKKEHYDFKSLLASVEKVRKAPSPTQSQPKEESAASSAEEVNLAQILTISERDLIAYKLKECWNVDAGIEGVEDIVINIQASITKDGRVREVKIKNTLTSQAMKSVAESARRAILICDNKGDDSPFKILADKYADHYNQWKELDLSFNPLEGSIF